MNNHSTVIKAMNDHFGTNFNQVVIYNKFGNDVIEFSENQQNKVKFNSSIEFKICKKYSETRIPGKNDLWKNHLTIISELTNSLNLFE